MSHYAITISPDEASQEFDVLLRGPGIESTGRRYRFINTHRCVAFAEAVNFAYDQGLREGLRRKENEGGRLSIVTGATPDSLEVRPEGLWPRLKRLWR